MNILFVSFLSRLVKLTGINSFSSNINRDNCYRKFCHLVIDEMLAKRGKYRDENLEELESSIKIIPINKKDELCFKIKENTKAGRKMMKCCKEIENRSPNVWIKEIRM
ncbi:hypothetical protein CWI38_0173p0030 [Hamiltosporidium tvaerminnensis]|uniref:Uncharacterized protein n=1 Tax=Hamiltosporidium tvaerminnensis TaxID=1176355 RepID=A0A4Q9LZZ7_9MICR|nr:hypothetical protein CWI37_0207p0050 [Hamiltosporidium tvaerminnensis]TBU19899.1 hypothetical protein CWI38_0178p0050 [Hamiltosporidium tvaerminnensis]TBU19921.1 hypothetical protein CWI38_0173p0030 [Hamiltosporidium tvaerminnensis]